MFKFNVKFADGNNIEHVTSIISSNNYQIERDLQHKFKSVKLISYEFVCEVFNSRYSDDIIICMFDNGWHLESNGVTDSPLNLIPDEKLRKLIIMEADIYKGYQSDSQEFKVGEFVTFDSYSGRIKAKVRKVTKPCYANFINKYFYTYDLEGISAPLRTETSGVCIVESRLYRDSSLYPYKN